MSLQISNKEFIEAIFGEDAPWCHVTDFPYDPSNIPKERKLGAWKGDYYSRYKFGTNTNQYFTISCFYADEEQQARRRRILYRFTCCIVLDDVREKLSMTEVSKLPEPSWILETSPGSEQWGYILDTPCVNPCLVENLLDGLVANGLAPDGKDPGMKGVTRYVRLPEGINSKESKLVEGRPFDCRMLRWQPMATATLEQLASPLAIDLNRERKYVRADGAADVSDHPLIQIPDTISIKEVRSKGRFDITCPWVDEHTGSDDSGTAVFTNEDGTIGFKCHHGNCQERTGAHLLQEIERSIPGFGDRLKSWQVVRELNRATTLPVTPVTEEISFMQPVTATPPAPSQPPVTGVAEPISSDVALQELCGKLRGLLPGSEEQRSCAATVLKLTDTMPKMEQKHWHGVVADTMRWSKIDLKDILTDLRQTWYREKVSNAEFYDNIVFVKEQNRFFDRDTGIFYSAEAFRNSFWHEDPEVLKIALQEGRVQKVDKIDYAPKKPQIFAEGGLLYANTWSESSQVQGTPGDISWWRDHFNVLGWEEHRDHIEKWMSFTLRHPDQKINHMLLLGGPEGCGKDFLLYPLTRAMGDNHTCIEGANLSSDFNEYLLSTKYLHFNEVELNATNPKESQALVTKLLPLAACPPHTLRVNQKGISPVKVRNIVNCTMTTNGAVPFNLRRASRRFYAVWSELWTRDAYDNVSSDWKRYWSQRWPWMENGGWESVTHYLMNEVDLSDFNPGEAPKTTEFLREIQDASKPAALQMIETFIEMKHGLFMCDIITSADMSETLRAGAALLSDVTADPRSLNTRKVASIMKEAGKYPLVRSRHRRFWVLRDREKYVAMGAKELEAAYHKQISDARKSAHLTEVK